MQPRCRCIQLIPHPRGCACAPCACGCTPVAVAVRLRALRLAARPVRLGSARPSRAARAGGAGAVADDRARPRCPCRWGPACCLQLLPRLCASAGERRVCCRGFVHAAALPRQMCTGTVLGRVWVSGGEKTTASALLLMAYKHAMASALPSYMWLMARNFACLTSACLGLPCPACSMTANPGSSNARECKVSALVCLCLTRYTRRHPYAMPLHAKICVHTHLLYMDHGIIMYMFPPKRLLRGVVCGLERCDCTECFHSPSAGAPFRPAFQGCVLVLVAHNYGIAVGNRLLSELYIIQRSSRGRGSPVWK